MTERRADFRQVLDRMTPEIDRIVSGGRQRVPGFTQEEVRSEMVECLWNAKRTFSRRSGVPFEAYWWSVWLNRKADLLKFTYRGRRDVRRQVLRGYDWFAQHGTRDRDPDLAALPVYDPVEERIPAPPSDDPVEQRMWYLIAVGATRQDVILLCDIGKRRYYKILQSWHHERVWEALK